ncbi:hypothetical protein PLICRDRAFT_40475 [Plicaturopsis crispa FD-325 SS-3]|nr:hypothetical protein PLICRDRAFT_40475 [Plicaturopsis crispa FD-325 SS-3]
MSTNDKHRSLCISPFYPTPPTPAPDSLACSVTSDPLPDRPASVRHQTARRWLSQTQCIHGIPSSESPPAQMIWLIGLINHIAVLYFSRGMFMSSNQVFTTASRNRTCHSKRPGQSWTDAYQTLCRRIDVGALPRTSSYNYRNKKLDTAVTIWYHGLPSLTSPLVTSSAVGDGPV